MYVSTKNAPDLPPGGIEAGGAPSRTPRAGKVGGAVIAVGMVSFFTDVSSEMVSAVLPLFLIVQVGLTPLQYGLVDGLYQGATVAVRLAGGYLADRWRRPKLICGLGYGLSAVTKLGFMRVGSASGIGAMVALDRTGKGIRTAPRDAIIAASADRAVLGRAFGVHRSLDTAGAMAGPFLAFALLYAVPGSYDSVFFTSFWIAVLGLAVLVLYVPDVRVRPARQARQQRQVTPRAALRLVADRRVAALVAVAGLLGLLTVSDGFVYLTLQRRLSVSADMFPLMVAGMSASYLLLAVPAGRLADRYGRWRTFLTGHVALLGAYLVLLGTANGLLTCLTVLALLGAFYAATDGVLAATAADLLPDELRGTGIALVQTAVAAGRLVSSVVFGLLWTTLGGQTQALRVFTVALTLGLPAAWLLFSRLNERHTP